MAEGASLAAFRADRGADEVASPAGFGSDLAGVPRFRRSSIRTRTLKIVGVATKGFMTNMNSMVDAGILDLATSPLISSWGRKPA